jgi:AraC family transcriptional regulator, regulatory protein of adaptative response / methylated-DNA-[protein]-cysteine methyltransferase
MYRINHAFQEFKVNKNVINTAYDTGDESLSGFGYTYKKITKNAPINEH